MEIAAQTVVNLSFILTDEEGNIFDQSIDGSFVYVHGHGRILPGLERALVGKKAGDSVEVTLSPSEAFGERHPDLTEIAHRSLFKGLAVKPGMEFQARDKQGRTVPLRVVRVDGDDIHVDANHPLAGITLYFSLDVLKVRAATDEESRTGMPAASS
jgi:FKBP-type peptidyl-prolyl cis-trans isomerase SlyD